MSAEALWEKIESNLLWYLSEQQDQKNGKIEKILRLHEPVTHTVFEPDSESNFIRVPEGIELLGEYRKIKVCRSCNVLYPCPTIRLIVEER